MDEVIPFDHPRRFASPGDPIVWPHPLDVIQYARSSNYYNNVYVSNTAKPDTHSRYSNDASQKYRMQRQLILLKAMSNLIIEGLAREKSLKHDTDLHVFKTF